MSSLPEQLLLISIDHEGTPRDPRSSLGYALAGAALSELLLAGRLRQEGGKLVVAAQAPTGDAFLDEVLARVAEETSPRTLKWWVTHLASRHRGPRPVRDQLIDQLTAQGVLARGERRVLGLVPVATHPVADPALGRRVRAALGDVLLSRREPDERSAALVALVQVSGLIDACVPDGERRRARQRASQIAAGNEVGQAVKRIQEEVIAAVTAAVIAASAASSAGTQT